jgi:hypothetical protein
MIMAAEVELEKEAAVHRQGYVGFVSLMKWGAVLSAIVAMIVVFLIAD